MKMEDSFNESILSRPMGKEEFRKEIAKSEVGGSTVSSVVERMVGQMEKAYKELSPFDTGKREALLSNLDVLSTVVDYEQEMQTSKPPAAKRRKLLEKVTKLVRQKLSTEPKKKPIQTSFGQAAERILDMSANTQLEAMELELFLEGKLPEDEAIAKFKQLLPKVTTEQRALLQKAIKANRKAFMKALFDLDPSDKDKVAKNMVQAFGPSAHKLVTAAVNAEIKQTKKEGDFLRGNDIASKLLKEYQKVQLANFGEVPTKNVKETFKFLNGKTQSLPPELKSVYKALYTTVLKKTGNAELAQKHVTAAFMLRFVNPKIAVKNKNLAKLMQNIANNTTSRDHPKWADIVRAGQPVMAHIAQNLLRD